MPAGWSGAPLDVGAANRWQWVSERKGVTGGGPWGAWSRPVLWSHRAEGIVGPRGRDGPGVEFVFRRSATEVPPPRPATTADQRRIDDYVPTGWADDALGVSAAMPILWASKRVGTSGAWGEFGPPSIWARYSEDGAPGADGRDGAPGPRGRDGAPGPTGPTGPRGAGVFSARVANAAWSNSAANSATPGDNVRFDRVTLYTASWAETRAWDGTAWIAAASVVDGNQIVDGTVLARALDTDSLSTEGLAVFGDSVQSANYVSGSTGWRIRQDGDAEFNGPVISRNVVLNQGAFTYSGRVGDGDRIRFVNSGIRIGIGDYPLVTSKAVHAFASLTSTGTSTTDPNNTFWGVEAYIVVGARVAGWQGENPTQPNQNYRDDPLNLVDFPGATGTDQRLFFNIHFHDAGNTLFRNPRIAWKVILIT